MPKKVGTQEWRRKRRQEYMAKKEHRYYIFCEGEQTEPLYFEGFKRLIEENPIYKDMVLVEIEPCGTETLRVVQQAEQYVSKNDITKGQIWCVYDKDSFPAKDFNGAAERIAKLNEVDSHVQYHAAWSNECIEFWFLLHFDVVVCIPARKNRRIDNQEGAFIVCGLLEETYGGKKYNTLSNLRLKLDNKKITICIMDKKAELLNELESLGITKAKIYPEIDDVADYIKTHVNIPT